jgi:hypothetical protein
MAVSCSLEDTVISLIKLERELVFSKITFRDSAVWFAVFFPTSTLVTDFSIRTDDSFVASALLAARFLTSSATTANPLPCFPALAASTAALSAKRFV